MSDKNVSHVTNNNNAQPILPPQSVRVGSGGKKHSIDDIIDHMTADLQSYEGQYIVLGSPHNNPQHNWSEYNSANNNSRTVTAANPVNHGTQPAVVTQLQVSQVVGNHPIFLQQSSPPVPPQQFELHDRNVDFQTQQCGGLFYTNPAARVQETNAGSGPGAAEMIGMVDVGGGNYVNVVFNTTTPNPHGQLHPNYAATTTSLLQPHPAAIPTPADNTTIGYIYQQHQQPISNSNQMRDYGLFSKETPTSSQQPNRQLIENLVGNWLPNQSGTYSPFGGNNGRPAHSVDNGDNLGVHLNNSNTGVSPSPCVANNSTNRKHRVVAEVRPMPPTRPTYSDVLTKSAPQINNSNNNNSAKVSLSSLTSNTTQSGNTTPKSESRKHNNKSNKSGGNKENLSNSKNNSSNLRRQHSGGSDDNNSCGSRLISNIHKWMSIEELTPPHSGSEHNYDHNTLDDSSSGVNYDNDGLNCKRGEKKQKKRSTKQKVNDEKIESLNNDKVGGVGCVHSTNGNSNNNNNNNNNNNSSFNSSKRSLPINNNLLRNRSNVDKNLSKSSKKGVSKEDSKIGLGSMAGLKRSQRSGKRRNCQTYLGMLWNKWQHYTILFASWFFNLIWDVLALSSRLSIHLVAVSFDYALSMLHCSKVYIRGIFGSKTNANFNNSNSNNSRFKNGQHEHMNGSSKGSWWKFWDRNKKPPCPEKPHNTGGLTNNMAIPTTGDEAIRRLLSCKGKDPYSILGVTRHCSDDDIKKYYKRQAVLVHPDKNSQPGAEEAFKILVHAFELIGEPERRSRYDHCVAETHQMEHAWTELNDLLTQLHQKMEYTVNTIRCTNCGKRHRRVPVQRPCYAARFCAQCKIHHSAREGDIWAESWIIGFVWHYYACMEGQIYNITEWATCQAENLQHLKANSHAVQYRIVLGGKQQQQQHEPQQSQPQTPPPQQQPRQSEPDLEEFFNNLYSRSTGNNINQGSGDSSMSRHRRKTKRKK